MVMFRGMEYSAPLDGHPDWMGDDMRDSVPQSKHPARPRCGHYVRRPYQALPPAEPQPSSLCSPFLVLPKHGPSLAGLNIPVLCNLYHFLP